MSLYRDHYEEWIADVARRVHEHAERGELIAERLGALEQDRERVLVLGNYGLEAWREAIDRRRAMLGDAAVAAVFSELSAAELARVERTIRMLDPGDLDLLALLFSADGGETTKRKEWSGGGVTSCSSAVTWGAPRWSLPAVCRVRTSALPNPGEV